MVGLDPSMGIMHANAHNRPALAFDHIEAFRPWVDKIVVELILTNRLTSAQLVENEEGLFRLNKEARRALIDAFFAKMEERSYLNGKRIKNIDHIRFQCSQLVATLKKQPYFGV